MEQQFDAQDMMQRAGEVAREVRKSDAYPALIGGVAGGVAGALMAVIIARRVISSRPATVEETVKVERSDGGAGWSLREVVQLATVVASLAKQAQDWYASRKEQQI
jgi:hypothetical protein